VLQRHAAWSQPHCAGIQVITTVSCLLPPTASYCVLPTAPCLLPPTASCLLPPAYCLLLPPAPSCLLPPAASFLLPIAGALLSCRGCEPGEQYDNNVCRECQEQTYSFHPGDNGGQCQTCPDTAHCPGGPIFVPDDYYWHSAFDSDTAQRCPNTFACRLGSAVTPLHSALTGDDSHLVCICDLVCDKAHRAAVSHL